MADQHRFRLNSPEVVAEAVDGEAIVLNLGTGIYYSIKGDTILLWNAVVGGATTEELTDAVSERTGEGSEAVAGAIAEFVASLEAEGLIVDRNGEPSDPHAVDLAGEAGGLLELRFETHADMRDLILLDPVHQVDERGWPHARTTA